MRYFFDTEFHQAMNGRPNSLISIGVVREDGASYYAENEAWDRNTADPWLREHVIPHLKGGSDAKPPSLIRYELMMFTQTDERCEFWAYYGAYDWVFMCMLFGGFSELPPNWEKNFYELKQYAEFFGTPRGRWPKQEGAEHNALNDAIWNREVFLWIWNQTSPSAPVVPRPNG